MSSAVIKKNAMDLAFSVYKVLTLAFSNFKLSVDKLRNTTDSIDLTNSLVKSNFSNSYNILLSDLNSTIVNILQSRRTIRGDDGALVIKPVTSTDL